MRQDFSKESYDRHTNQYEISFDKELLASWLDKNTTDYWRHERIYCTIDPLISADKKAKWLTIGDGRFGRDANYILSKGATNVLASDISDTCLKVGVEEKFIPTYAIENAESLSLENDTIDYVMCKESYHHFPRPMIALYEMIRVAKKSVILIEPQDSNVLIPSRFKIRTLLKWSIQAVKNVIKGILGKEPYYNYGMYEEVGNYVYTISEREIEKVALGLNYEMVSFKGINDHYIDGGEFEEKKEGAPIYSQIQQVIRTKDTQAKKGKQQTDLLIAMIHKTTPDKKTLDELKAIGFVHRKLSRNPYI